MKKKGIIKALVSIASAFLLTASASVPVLADGEETTPVAGTEIGSFTKTYNVSGTDAESPAETFSFTSPTLVAVKDTSFNTTGDVQEIKNLNLATAINDNIKSLLLSSASFGKVKAGTTNSTQTVTISLPENVTANDFPSTGHYYYDFNENTTGTTAGVSYNTNTYRIEIVIVNKSTAQKDFLRNTTDNTVLLTIRNQSSTSHEKSTGLENTYSAGQLTVQKKVTGNLADANQSFAVTVIFNAPAGKTVRSDITYTKANEPTGFKLNEGTTEVTGNTISAGTGWTTKTITFNVKDNTTISFFNIPTGVEYTVNEERASGYDEPKYTSSNSGTIVTTANTVLITNNKNTTIDSGVFLNNMPYIIVFGIAAAALVVFFVTKHHKAEE